MRWATLLAGAADRATNPSVVASAKPGPLAAPWIRMKLAGGITYASYSVPAASKIQVNLCFVLSQFTGAGIRIKSRTQLLGGGNRKVAGRNSFLRRRREPGQDPLDQPPTITRDRRRTMAS